jgi:PAS domain S-box-containing protein
MAGALRRVLLLVAVTAAYFVSGRLGLSLAVVHWSASAVWPPTGVALAAVLFFGPSMWPALAAGAFLVNFSVSGSLTASAGIAAGNTMEALLGGWLLQRYAGGRSAVASTAGIFRFVGFAAIAALVGATVGLASLTLTGFLGSSDPSKVWLTWWLGDATGAILVTPLILLWAHPGERLSEARALEFAVMLGSVVFVGLVMFAYRPIAGVNLPIEFLAIPVLIWAAFRFAQREAVTACGLLSGLAVWGTVRGYGPFGAYPPEHALPMLQGFTGSLSVTVLAASAEVAIRRQRDWEVRRLNEELERRVLARTEEARRAHARLAEAQEVGHVGSWEWNIALNTVWWSVELYRIYGVSPADVVPSYEGFLERVHPDDRAAVDREVRTALEQRDAFSFEHRLVRPDGSVRTMYARGLVACDDAGNPVRMTGIAQDITERKQAEEARALLIHEQAARREAEEASRSKDAFLASLSHELRTPLNAILGWTHMILHGAVDDASRKRAVETIYRNAVAQQRLVSDILDVARIASGRFRMKVEPVGVGALADSAIDAVRPMAAANNVRLELEVDPHAEVVSGDETRLRQVLTNLLDNAIKFSPAGGEVRLQVVRCDDWVSATVRDEGPGIEPAFLPHVFEQFRQSDPSTTREHAGLGLGLSIVQRIVELHGGTVAAENRTDRSGAIFTVRLPVTVSAAVNS